MSRRPRSELEQEPHYVYVHYNEHGAPIYVGRTVDPDNRPHATKGRPWIRSESDSVEVSPAMTFQAACWVESELIRGVRPKHNRKGGQREMPDWRLDRIVAVLGGTRTGARTLVAAFPTQPEEFEARLAQMLAYRAGLGPRSTRSEAARRAAATRRRTA